MKFKPIVLFSIFLCAALISFCQEEQIADSAKTVQAIPIYKEAEEMPRFPGCEDISLLEERKECAMQKLLEFVYSNVKYPILARENGVEGTIVIRFVISADGSLRDYDIVRDMHARAGLGAEGLRVVKLMPNWIPGKLNGEPVNVYFNLPIKFALEKRRKSKKKKRKEKKRT